MPLRTTELSVGLCSGLYVDKSVKRQEQEQSLQCQSRRPPVQVYRPVLHRDDGEPLALQLAPQRYREPISRYIVFDKAVGIWLSSCGPVPENGVRYFR